LGAHFFSGDRCDGGGERKVRAPRMAQACQEAVVALRAVEKTMGHASIEAAIKSCSKARRDQITTVRRSSLHTKAHTRGAFGGALRKNAIS